MHYRTVLLNYLDEPVKFLLWTFPEIISFVIPLFTCLFLGSLIMGCLIGLLLFFLYRFIRQKVGHGGVKAFLYWYLPTPTSSICMPSYQREWIA